MDHKMNGLMNELELCFQGWNQNQDDQQEFGQIQKEFLKLEQEDKYLNTLNEKMITMGTEMNEMLVQADKSKQQSPQTKLKQGQFPPFIDSYRHISSIEDFKQILQRQKIKYSRQDIKYYVRRYRQAKIGKDTIVATCSSCRTSKDDLGKKKIILKRPKDSEIYQVRFFDNKHNHVFHEIEKHKRLRKGSILLKPILKQFQNAPKSMSTSEFVTKMALKYHCEQKKVREILYSYRRKNQNFKQVTQLADNCSIKYWFKNKASEEEFIDYTQAGRVDQQPELFIFISDLMHERFSRVGEVCYFTVLDFRLRGTDPHTKWALLALSGLTLNYMVQPFAFAFVQNNYMRGDVIAGVLSKIFTIFNQTSKVIITPSDDFYSEMVACLRERYKFRGQHFFDPIIEIEQIGRSLDNFSDLSHFKNIILCRTQAEYHSNLQKLLHLCKPTPTIRHHFNRVLKFSSKLCFSCIQTTQHTGVIFDFSANKLITVLVKESLLKLALKFDNNQGFMFPKVTYLQNGQSAKKLQKSNTSKGSNHLDYAKVNFSKISYIRCAKSLMFSLRRFIRPMDNSSNYDLKPYENVLDMPEIIPIRRCIKSNLLSVFGQQYGKIYFLDHFERPNKQIGSLRVYDIYDRTAKTIFTVAPSPLYLEDGSLDKFIWKCNCLFSSKCGVPCSHQILATMLAGSSLFELFKKEFVISQKYKKVGRPRLSSRNKDK